MPHASDATPQGQTAAWPAVLSLASCVAVLIASEFMPVSLLTPIAADLAISEGQAGQAISISGLFAVVTSLVVAGVTRRIDRRVLMVTFSLLLALSGAVVALAPNFAVLMVGRALLGVVIGGFWSMSIAIVMRLVPPDAVPRGLAILNIGVALSSTVSAPLGSYLGDVIGWRGAFLMVVPLALLTAAFQLFTLPSLPPLPGPGSRNPFVLLKRRQVSLGMAAIFFVFMGQFALFTYLRPYLQGVAGFSVSELSLILLAMGLATIAGTSVAGWLLGRSLYPVLVVAPLLMAALALGAIAFVQSPLAVVAVLVAWGFVGNAAPIGWGSWISRALRDQAELGGGLQVAVIQLAITAGAATGGLFFDAVGWWSTLTLAAAMLVLSATTAAVAAHDASKG